MLNRTSARDNLTTYSYDSHGSISGITVNPVNANGSGVGGTAQTLLSGITYTALNQVSGWQWSDGKARTIGYDGNGLVTSYTLGDPMGTGNAAGLLRTVQRDAAGRITGYTHTNNGAPVASLAQSFGYDNLNRLTSATLDASGILYTYDATGNRTSRTVGGTTYGNTISPSSNRLTQVQDVPGTASISHDAAGNVIGDGSFTFSYSDRGRMASVTTGAGTVSYLYNGLGQRASKSGPAALVATGTVYYLYDEAGQLLGEYDADGRPIHETIYLGSAPVGVMKQSGSAANADIATTVYNAYADHIDTTRMITRQDHAIVWRWDTAEAFGASAPQQDPSSLGSFVYNQRFPGQTFDAETGLFQNWHRDYDARIGRYRQSDPIGLAGGINTFAYAESSPLSLIDPMGLMGGSGSGAAHRKPPPTVSGFGCMGLMCITGGWNNPTQGSAELTFGGGVEICDAPPPPPEPQACLRKDPNVQVQPMGVPMPETRHTSFTRRAGLFIGPSIKRDGTVCVRFGPHYSVPVPSVDLGPM